MGTVIRRKTAGEIVELARRIVTDRLLIVNPERYPEWGTSLLWMAESLNEIRNLGAVLVPVAPHLGKYWLNGHVPAVTFVCEVVAKGDLPALAHEIERMEAALFPEPR